MRWIHTSDWHLGRLFFGESLTEEQAALLIDFVALAKDQKPDAVLIAGDVYDRSVPPANAVELLDEVLAKLVLECDIPVLMISGNHDSGPRLAFGKRFFGKNRLHVCSSVEPGAVTLTDQWGPVNFSLIPYADTATVRLASGDETVTDADAAIRARLENCRQESRDGRRNVALVHAFLTGGQCSESERPLSVGGTGAVSAQHFDDFQYVAMGHLHRPQQMKNGRLVYSGSLMKYSFEEADHKKGVNCVEMDGSGQLRQEFLPLPSLRDVRVKEGLFEELMKGPRMDENPGDYLSITLLDEAPVIQAIHRLRTLYPKTMEISYRYQQDALQKTQGQRPDHRTLPGMELFESFAEWSTAKPLSDRQRGVMQTLLAENGQTGEGTR